MLGGKEIWCLIQIQSVIGIFLLIKVKLLSLFLEKVRKSCTKVILKTDVLKMSKNDHENTYTGVHFHAERLQLYSRMYWKPYQTSTMDIFGWKLLTVFPKRFILILDRARNTPLTLTVYNTYFPGNFPTVLDQLFLRTPLDVCFWKVFIVIIDWQIFLSNSKNVAHLWKYIWGEIFLSTAERLYRCLSLHNYFKC